MSFVREPLTDLASLPARVHQLIDPWARATPQAVAVSDAAGALTYSALAQETERLAAALRAAGVLAGERIILVCENCVAAALFVLAASRCDAWIVPVNARLAKAEIDAITAHSGARALFFTLAASREARALAQSYGASPFDFPGHGEIAVLWPAGARAPEPVEAAPERQVALLIYTSGTTGVPKGVMLSHRNIAYVAVAGAKIRATGPGDRIYCVLPVSHVYGIASVLFGTLANGGRLDLVARFSPADMARALREDAITVLYGVPAMYAKLLDHYRETGAAPSAPELHAARAGGAPLDLSLKQRFEAAFGVALGNGYGLTEAAATVAATRPSSPRADGSVGHGLPDLDLEIRDTAGAPVKKGDVGTLFVRGPNIMLGYYRDAAATAAVLDARGFFDTGDLARELDDGAIEIAGRMKELIIRSGFNVYPPDVEQAINAHPDVLHSAVVGRAVEGNEEVIAFVEAAPGRALDTEALRSWLRGHLAPYKIPSLVITGPLPATSTGKILKSKLKARASAPDFPAKGE